MRLVRPCLQCKIFILSAVAIGPVTGHDFHSYRSGNLADIIFKKKPRKQT